MYHKQMRQYVDEPYIKKMVYANAAILDQQIREQEEEDAEILAKTPLVFGSSNKTYMMVADPSLVKLFK